MRHVQRSVIFIGLALSVACCAKDAWGPMTEADGNELACNSYGFYPGTQQYDDCLKYIRARRGDRAPAAR
jgi:hypothetical protein